MHTLLLALSLFSAPEPLASEDWPGWRGPGGQGIAAAEATPPSVWSEEKNIRWKVALPGKGSSCPVVSGDKVYVTAAVSTGKKQEATPEPQPEEGGRGRGRGRGGFGGRGGGIEEQEFRVLAFARKDGELLWEAKASTQMPHEGTHSDGTYATPTLVTDGELVIASFGSYGLYAYDTKGELVWAKDLGDMQVANSFGEGSSPVLSGKYLVVLWDHQGESFLVALDKTSGEELWRTERPSMTNWCTPLITELGGKPQVVVGSYKTVSYDLATGAELWSFGSAPEPSSDGGRGGRGGGGTSGVIASPVIAEGILYVPVGSVRGGELQALNIAKAKGTLDDEAKLWAETRDVPRIPSPVVADGILYAMKSSSGMLSAFDAKTGERHYGPVRLEGATNLYGSPVLSAGKLYVAGRDGMTEVVKAGDEFASLAINTLDDGFDSSPAIVGAEIYLRGRANLYCIAEDEADAPR